MTIRDVVFRDIKTTTVTQMRDLHIRDKIIKDFILLGTSLKFGMYSILHGSFHACTHEKPS